AEHIVHLVGTGVVELLALEIDLGAAAALGQALREIEWRRPSDIGRKIAIHLAAEFGIRLCIRVGALKIKDQGHQGLGHKAATVDAEMTVLVRTGAVRIGGLHVHGLGARSVICSPFAVRYVPPRARRVSFYPRPLAGRVGLRAARMKSRMRSGSFSP